MRKNEKNGNKTKQSETNDCIFCLEKFSTFTIKSIYFITWKIKMFLADLQKCIAEKQSCNKQINERNKKNQKNQMIFTHKHKIVELVIFPSSS